MDRKDYVILLIIKYEFLINHINITMDFEAETTENLACPSENKNVYV